MPLQYVAPASRTTHDHNLCHHPRRCCQLVSCSHQQLVLAHRQLSVCPNLSSKVVSLLFQNLRSLGVVTRGDSQCPSSSLPTYLSVMSHRISIVSTRRSGTSRKEQPDGFTLHTTWCFCIRLDVDHDSAWSAMFHGVLAYSEILANTFCHANPYRYAS